MLARICLLALGGLTSCSTLELEFGLPLDLETFEAFEPGRTTRAEVLEALGPPVDLAAHDGGVALLYEHVLLDELQLGVSLDQVGVLLKAKGFGLFKASLGGSGSRREAALLLFDAEGVLTSLASSTWGEDFGRGGSMQFVATIDQVVDSESLRVQPDGLVWGTRLLAAPLVSMNDAHQADVELRGTPEHCGQRSMD